MSYLVIDLETEGTEKRGRFCDPLDLDHKIITIQWKEHNKEPLYKYDYNGISRDLPINFMKYDVIVGQNVKFDLLWLWGNKNLREWLRKGGKIWDIMTIDYLLSGQNLLQSYSLNELAKRYAAPLKYEKKFEIDDNFYTVNDMYKKPLNYTTTKIIDTLGFDEYVNYMKGDVITTEDIYLKQLQKVKELNMEGIVDIYMEYYLQLTEVEYNGIYIDKDSLERLNGNYLSQVEKLQTKITEDVKTNRDIGWPEEIELNLRSVDHLSALCYSGYLKAKLPTNIYLNGEEVTYKTGTKKGQVKTRLEEKKFYVPGYGLPIGNAESSKKVGVYKSSHKILSSFNDKRIANLVEYKKILTIADDLDKKIHKNMNPFTGCIHSSFNTATTATSRISSRAPNLQNINPKTLTLFSSRHKDGLIVEMDWNQIEVAVAAWVFKENLLAVEILQGIDIHRENAKKLFNKEDISPKERKIAKFLTFGILYRQGAYSLAKTHGITVDKAEEFIRFFYNKYVEIALAHSKLEIYVNNNKKYSGVDNINICTIKMPWNKRYTVRDWPWKDTFTFNPSQYCNYVIQGSAGDIQALAAGILFRHSLKNSDSYAIVNNVHDSFILDFRNKEEMDKLLPEIISEIEASVSKFTKTNLFKLEAKFGKNWAEAKE